MPFSGTSLHNNVMNNVKDTFVTMAAVETFLAAVPISKEDMTPDLRTKLGAFAIECMHDLGGYKLLDKALKRTQKGTMQHAYLSAMNSMALEAAQTIADRVIEEHKGDADLETIKKAAEKVTYTQDEVEKLKSGVDKVNDEKLSETIQTKVLDVIKEERDAYTKDAELEQEIKEAVKQADPTTDPDKADSLDDPGMSEETGIEPVESDGDVELTGNDEKVEASESAKFDKYMESVLGHPNERIRHASFFSTLQEMALEAILTTNEKYGENDLPTKTMSLITRRNTFEAFESYRKPSTMTALESLVRLNTMESMATPDTPATAPDVENTQERALLVASVIYTFFETLNTMNLYCPGLNEVQKFVEETIPLSKMVEDDRARFMHDLTGIVSDAVYNVNKAKSVPEVAETRTDLEAVREACCSCRALESELPIIKKTLEPVIEQATLKIQRLRQAAKDAASVAPAVESQMEQMHRTRDTLKFSRAASSFAQKRNVHSVRFRIDPTGTAMGRNYVAMECMDASGAVTDRSSIALEQQVAAESMPSYVETCIRGSKLPTLDKPIMLVDRKNGKTYAQIGF